MTRRRQEGVPRDEEVNLAKSIARWVIVLALGLAFSAAALFAKEFVVFARTSAPLSRAFSSWFGLLFHGTQALTYITLGGAMVLVADRLLKGPGLNRLVRGPDLNRQRSSDLHRQRSSYEEQPYR
jgi:hypothetical protein